MSPASTTLLVCDDTAAKRYVISSWLRRAGYDVIGAGSAGEAMQTMAPRSVDLVVLDVHLRFVQELRNRQAVTIRTWIDSYSGKIGKLAQQVLDDAGGLCCDAKLTIGLFDLQARKLIRPTPEWVRGLGLRPGDLARG